MPREVTASVPLVYPSQGKPNKQEIPSQYWSVLSDPQKSHLPHDKYQIQMASLYISALGLVCRELIIVDKENKLEKRITCENDFIDENKQQNKAWFLEKQIIESSSYVEL
ncbi:MULTISPECIES: hypothetical protein [Colwellia]|uniref:Uncharacterized protein n=1 Tax=Colwellia marinimaniae TaxID=1513592 RepID=A0ABQ0MZJ7_9GAMM|nr:MULTISPECIES: hypothetical protein [Colwellia]GAW97791.1 hypothetical protein MTCD1_03435 [Colwellia marinimaniae]